MLIKDIKDKKLKKDLKKIMKYGNKIGFILQKNYSMLDWRLMLDTHNLREIMSILIKVKNKEKNNGNI